MKNASADPVKEAAADRQRARDARRRALLKWSLLVVVLAVGLAVDLVTKHWAEQHLALGETRQLSSFFSLQRTANNGVAFGLLGGNTAVIIVTNIIAIAVVCAYVVWERHPVLAGLAGGSVIAGSLGNMIQRLANGHVTDFMKFPHWPNFNVADILIDAGIAAIFVGLVIEAILMWRAERHRTGSP